MIDSVNKSSNANLWLWASGFLCCWSMLFVNNPFFFDTVLYSRQADWFLNANFNHLILPSDLDAGHPPFFSAYLAAGWMLAGQSLWVAHILMLPACVLLGWGLARLIQTFIEPKGQYPVLILALSEPTLLAQSSLVANDLFLVAGAFVALAGIHQRNPHLLGVGMLLSAAVSLRGIMLCPVYALYILLFHKEMLRQFKTILIPILWVLPIALWMLWHYAQTGWLTRPISDNWSAQHNLTDLDGVIHNIFSIAFRFADFGRALIVLPLIFLLLKLRSRLVYNMHPLLGLILIGITVHSIWFLPFQNPPGHRYFLTWFILILIFFGDIIFRYVEQPKRFWYSAIFVLLSGHAWVYPDSIAKGWDSSLAYLPWSGLRTEAVAYMKQQAIPPDKVGSTFPLLHPGRYTHLNGESWRFSEKDLSSQVYVLYSNLCSGFTDEEREDLEKYWDVEASWGIWPVRMILYRNPEQIPAIPSGKEMALR